MPEFQASTDQGLSLPDQGLLSVAELESKLLRQLFIKLVETG